MKLLMNLNQKRMIKQKIIYKRINKHKCSRMCRTLWMAGVKLPVCPSNERQKEILKLVSFETVIISWLYSVQLVQKLHASLLNVSCLWQLFWKGRNKETLISNLSLIFTTVSLREVGAKQCLKKYIVRAGLSIIKTDLGKKTSRKERVRAGALIISRWFIKHSYTFHSQTCQSDLGTLFSSFDMQVFEVVWALQRSLITALSPFPNPFDKKNQFRK